MMIVAASITIGYAEVSINIPGMFFLPEFQKWSGEIVYPIIGSVCQGIPNNASWDIL